MMLMMNSFKKVKSHRYPGFLSPKSNWYEQDETDPGCESLISSLTLEEHHFHFPHRTIVNRNHFHFPRFTVLNRNHIQFVCTVVYIKHFHFPYVTISQIDITFLLTLFLIDITFTFLVLLLQL